MTERKDLTVKIAPTRKANPNFVETKNPGPGAYKELEKAKAYTLRKTIDCKLSKMKKTSFIDIYRDRRKWVPSAA